MSKHKRRPGRRVDATGRSIGPERYVRLFHWEIRSPAYRSLGVGPRALLVELKALFDGSNNGDLFLSVREAARRLNVGKNFAAKCFRQLEDRGFIRANRVGAFNMKSAARRGNATTWILTEFEFASALPTKDFMRWRPTTATPFDKLLTVPVEGQTVSPNGSSTGADGETVSPAGTESAENTPRRSPLEVHS